MTLVRNGLKLKKTTSDQLACKTQCIACSI